MEIRSALRSAVLSRAPALGDVYRRLRERRAARATARPTAFEFIFAGDSSMADGSFEREEIGVFLRLLDSASVCIDIGANIGFYTCLAASRGKTVIAVEPMNRNLDLLCRNLSANEFRGVEVFPLGLSDAFGIKKIFGAGTGASFLEGWAGASQTRYGLVPVSTLDIILGGLPEGDSILIKMDVEGHEYEVLRGSERTLRRVPKPLWLVEICLGEHFSGGLNRIFRETFEVFWRHGYQAFVADAGRRLVSPDDVARWLGRGSVDFGSHNYLFL